MMTKFIDQVSGHEFESKDLEYKCKRLAMMLHDLMKLINNSIHTAYGDAITNLEKELKETWNF